MIRDMIPASTGKLKSMPANFNPAAPPIKLPGRSPKIAKSTSPAPAPMYAVFLDSEFFIFVSSFSSILILLIASCMPKCNCLNLYKRAGETFGTVESVKAVSELYCPVAGEVVEVNTALVSKPETINKDPHGEAWMIVLKITNPAGLAPLLDAKAYEALVASEAK